MSIAGEIVVGLVILVGLAGIVVQVLPGTTLVGGAILVWAIMTGGTAAWVVFAVAATCIVAAEGGQLLLAGVARVALFFPGPHVVDSFPMMIRCAVASPSRATATSKVAPVCRAVMAPAR